MQISTTFDERLMTATLYDNLAARDFFSMLPLHLKIEDFSSNETVAYRLARLSAVAPASAGGLLGQRR